MRFRLMAPRATSAGRATTEQAPTVPSEAVTGTRTTPRRGLSLLVVLAYLLAFLPLERHLGPAVEALCLVPVVAIAWCYGVRAGLGAALVALPANTVLLYLARLGGHADWSTALNQAAGPGFIGTVAVGVGVGVLREQARRLGARVSDREHAAQTAFETLRASEARHRAMVAHATDLVLIIDHRGVIRYASPSYERLLGHPPAAVEGHDVRTWLHPDDLPTIRAGGRLATRRGVATVAFRMRHADGGWRTLEAIGANRLRDPAIGGWLVNARDITERVAFEGQLQHQAFHDALTGLPNRLLFRERMDRALAGAARHQRMVAVLFLDLDRFKVINDSLGHEAGDRLLCEVATRLSAYVGAENSVARFGGDEFAVLLTEVADVSGVRRAAAAILAAFDTPILLGAHHVVVTASMGIVVSAPESTGPDLLRDADVALYQAKAGGRGRYQVFADAMNVHARERLALETDLRTALDRGELVVYYQPKVALATGACAGLEALVRWHSPARGLLPPAAFIPLAEEIGLIRPLGQWVFEEACRQAYRWNTSTPPHSPTPVVVSVNLSAYQLVQPTLVDDVLAALAASGADPAWLQIEITESAAMGDAESTIGTLRRLKEVGVQLAIDDFGTGYSSLAYLKRFPIDVLKIDRALVTGLQARSEDSAIVAAILGLARALGLAVVAEGVETVEDARHLYALGCEVGQGYYWARPLPPPQADAFVQHGWTHAHEA